MAKKPEVSESVVKQEVKDDLPAWVFDPIPEDLEGYADEPPILPYYTIRHKPIVDDQGKTIGEPGGFKTTQEGEDLPVLEGIIFGSQKGRVWFRSLEEGRPTCKSIDGKTGQLKTEETANGVCELCPQGQWTDKRPPCADVRNIALYRADGSGGLVYTIGRSGLKPFRMFMGKFKNRPKSVPAHFFVTRISTQFKAEPAGHFLPVFEVVRALTGKEIEETRSLRAALAKQFARTVEAVDHQASDFVGRERQPGEDDDDMPDFDK